MCREHYSGKIQKHKMLRYVILLFFLAHSNNANTVPMPVPKFEAFRPSGIRVSLPDTKGVSEFFLWANVNEPMEGKDLGSIQLATYEPTGGVWLIEDMDVKLNTGDTIYYTFFVNIDGVVYRYERQEYTVKEIVDRPTTPSATTERETTLPPTTKPPTTQPPTTKPPTTKPPTTPTTTTTQKPAPEYLCFDDTIYIKMTKSEAIISQKDDQGRDLVSIHNKDCNKLMVIDFEKGVVRFEPKH